ncbi:SRPBCC domain-containing protein [Piscinibacter sp. XHJ-5]|uniref:SRPBCC domain-containing protein n=1 Tax=Piscinibacter sp. XHJ-5 TaxID=3037797 RepID=UPI0024530BE3|nr:SRPBCC domain-containing protein [Piscinibacter sp. XHJ-5]
MAEATAQVSKTIGAPAERVWEALVTPALIKRYFFGSDVESDFRVGSPIRWRGEFNGKKYEDKGEVLVADRPSRLSVSHWSPTAGEPDAPEHYHVVTYDLAPQGSQTQVTLTQSNLTGGVKPSDVQKRAEFEKNWTMVLEGLAKLFA